MGEISAGENCETKAKSGWLSTENHYQKCPGVSFVSAFGTLPSEKETAAGRQETL